MHLCIYASMHLCIYASMHLCNLSFYRSIVLSFYLSIYLCIYASIDLSMHLCIYRSIYLSICLSVCLSVYLSTCLSASLKTSPPVESTAPATKKWWRVIRSAAPVTQNHLSKPEDLMRQNVTLLRKSAPGPPNMSDSCVFCTAPATQNASLQVLFSNVPRLPTFLKLLQNLHVLLTFGEVHRPSRLPHESTL